MSDVYGVPGFPVPGFPYRGPIAALIARPGAERFEIGAVAGTLLITAALFALQSRIEFVRDKDGKWSFKLVKKPTKDAIVTPLIKKLISLIAGGPPVQG